MLRSSLTNEVGDIETEDPPIPEAVRALHPHHIEVIPNFAVDIYRTEWPQEILTRRPGHTNTWTLWLRPVAKVRWGRQRDIEDRP